MRETLVVYYSKTGSNKFLAEKIKEKLNADIELLRPRLKAFAMISSLMNISFGIQPLKSKLKEYRQVILVGPIWMGRLISPLKSFLKKYNSKIPKLIFTTCCGSTDEKKMEQFGYALVFLKVRKIIGDKLVHAEAFPISLVLPEDQKENDDLIMKTRLSNENFNGEIRTRFIHFIDQINILKNSAARV